MPPDVVVTRYPTRNIRSRPFSPAPVEPSGGAVMAKPASQSLPFDLRAAWRVPTDLRGTARTTLWLIAGLVTSYVYMDLALFAAVQFAERFPVPTLPIPFFAP